MLAKMKQQRLKKGITQEELAKMVGVDRKTIINLENSDETRIIRMIKLRRSFIEDVAEALEMGISDLINTI